MNFKHTGVAAYITAALAVTALSLAGCSDNRVNPASAPTESVDVNGLNSQADEFSTLLVKTISKELTLTETQQTEFKRIAGEVGSKMKSRHEAHESRKAAVKTLAEEFKTASLSDASLKNVFGAHQALEQDAPFFQTKIVEAHDLLTPEQRETVAAKLVERQAKMESRGAKWAERKTGGWAAKWLGSTLNLSAEQQQAAEKLAGAMKQKFLAKRDLLKTETATFIDNFKQAKMDESVLSRQLATLLAEKAEMQAGVADAAKSFHQLLTPEQRVTVADKGLAMAEQMDLRRREGHHGRHGWGHKGDAK